MNLLIGSILIIAAIVLIFIGRPNKAGVHPSFLQFDAALVLFPPVILVLLAMGTAEVMTGLLGISH